MPSQRKDIKPSARASRAPRKPGPDTSAPKPLASMVDALPHALYSCGIDGAITYANRACSALTGYSMDEIMGMRVWDFMEPCGQKDALPEHLKELARARPEPEPFFCVNLTKDGRRKDVRIDWSYMFGAEGVEGFACILSDISESVKAQNAMAESERHFRQFASLLPEVAFEADAGGKITFANDNAFPLIGVSREEFERGIVVFDMVAPEDRPRALEDFRRVLGGEPAVGHEYTIVRSDSTRIPVLVYANRVLRDGRAGGIRGFVVDITKRRLLEEELKNSLNEKARLIKEVHHRVKNNLHIVQSLIRLQAGGVADEESRAYFLASEARVRALSMIHERLARSDDDAYITAKDYFRSLAVHLFRAQRLDSSRYKLEANIPDIRLDVDTAVPCGLIVNELVTNALKHAFRGRSEGTIYIELKGPDGGYVLSVRDNGVGLPDGLDVERAPTLGFKIVNSLVRQLRGRMEVERFGGAWYRIAFSEKPPPRQG